MQLPLGQIVVSQPLQKYRHIARRAHDAIHVEVLRLRIVDEFHFTICTGNTAAWPNNRVRIANRVGSRRTEGNYSQTTTAPLLMRLPVIEGIPQLVIKLDPFLASLAQNFERLDLNGLRVCLKICITLRLIPSNSPARWGHWSRIVIACFVVLVALLRRLDAGRSADTGSAGRLSDMSHDEK